MTPQEFSDFLKTIRYKPGFKILLSGSYFSKDEVDSSFAEIRTEDSAFDAPRHRDQYFILMEMLVTDAYDPLQRATLPIKKRVGVSKLELESLSKTVWIDLIYRHILDMETHEAGEFYQVNGMRPMDPHKKRGTA